MESIELLVHRYLNVELFTPGTDVCSHILKEVEQSEDILFYWESIASSVPAKCEPYSIELLKAVTELWLTVRGHSFAKDWTMKFQNLNIKKEQGKHCSQYSNVLICIKIVCILMFSWSFMKRL